MPKSIIDELINKYEQLPIALTGCSTTTQTLDCCEYDFIVLSDRDCCEWLCNDSEYAEIHTIPADQNKYALALLLQNMQIINDPSWIFATLKQDFVKTGPEALSFYSRKSAVDALFYANRSREVSMVNTLLSSLWLKCAAYFYLEAVIAKKGLKPMPTHMLAQLRSLNDDNNSIGITIASTCLGLERANRSSISRCVEAAIELNERIVKYQSKQIVARKVEFLLQSGMYADCYFYLGYLAKNAAVRLASNQKILRDHMFMINIAMDLTTDQTFISKFSTKLMEACNKLMLG